MLLEKDTDEGSLVGGLVLSTEECLLEMARYITTIEPEIIKSVLATDFKSFGLSESRKNHLKPFLGEGIFTTDGAAWQHSREMLRPNFVRSQVGDIELFERHVQNVFDSVPRDGSMVNLQDIFLGMTLDIATEFLLGESTGCLEPGGGNKEAESFVKAFNYAQNYLEGQEDGWGFLSLFLPNARLKREHKIVHCKSRRPYLSLLLAQVLL
jgi:cytochrome P450